MNTVGPTKAMREALEHIRDGCETHRELRMVQRTAPELYNDEGEGLTPRGHAARAAPRMTQAEYDWLCYIDAGAEGAPSTMYMRMFNRGWIEPATAGLTRLTHAGRTALNNVRAAMGSPDWKEGL